MWLVVEVLLGLNLVGFRVSNGGFPVPPPYLASRMTIDGHANFIHGEGGSVDPQPGDYEEILLLSS